MRRGVYIQLKLFIPCNVKMGPQVIDKNQPIRLAEFDTRAQKYGIERFEFGQRQGLGGAVFAVLFRGTSH
jgi:hypothetical protein